MSFASETKNELARGMPEKKCCELAEIAGFMRVASVITEDDQGVPGIRLVTENPAVARHYKKMIKAYFGIDAGIEVEKGSRMRPGRRYIIILESEKMSEQILRETGMMMVREGKNYITDEIYDGVIRTKCCRKAYLRGLFMGAGTMTNPEKEYHFEIVAPSPSIAEGVRRLINSFSDLYAKRFERRSSYVVYVKEAAQILDILAIMGANSAYFSYEDIKLRSELRGEANRRANCDQANIDKAVRASEKQIAAIKKLKIDALDDKLKEIAVLRLENPEASLTQLGEMLDPPLKKSGVNGRLDRIIKLAEEREN